MDKGQKFSVWYFLIALIVAWLFAEYIYKPYTESKSEVPYSEFLTDLETLAIDNVDITESRIIYTLKDNTSPDKRPIVGGVILTNKKSRQQSNNVKSVVKLADPFLIMRLSSSDVKFGGIAQRDSIMDLFMGILLPMLPLIIIWYLIFRNMRGGAGGGIFSFGKSRAKELQGEMTKTLFSDIGGAGEAEVELREIIDFLKDPKRFDKFGAKLPRGVLLVGPPGTGKTLLAKACAGEAGVPFFFITGSSFVEMFVGVGAARVRDLFEQAKKYQPCIIFIDEMDAVGRHRGAGLGGGHDEREQTLNQFLVELDGFDENTSTIVIAATNRPDILDPALLRPGRFDRHITVDRPDVRGREEILKVHMKEKAFADDVDVGVLARRTPGLVGADLENLVNEGALLAARNGREKIAMEDLEEGIERVMAGPERKSRILNDRERKIIAYHETGHAIVAKVLPGSDPVHKISIIPRGHAALGYTLQLPEEDRFLISRSELLNRISVLLSGRVAEEIMFNDVTSGAANDLERATQTARQMVTQLGMSETLGLVKLGNKREEIFLGRDISEDRNYSEEIAYVIDKEVKSIIDSCYERAKEILTQRRPLMDKIAAVLLEKEVIDAEEFDKLMTEDEKIEAQNEAKADEKVNELPEVRIDKLPNSNHDFLA